MVEKFESTRVCRCCGIERDIANFDLGGNRKPIHVCRKCRYAQQTISNLRNLLPEELSERQTARLNESQEWLQKCKEATGYVTNTRRAVERVDFTNQMDIAAMQAASAKKHDERVARAQALRAANPDTAVNLSNEMLMYNSGPQLAEAGFTYKEAEIWIKNNIDPSDPDYDALMDKTLEIA